MKGLSHGSKNCNQAESCPLQICPNNLHKITLSKFNDQESSDSLFKIVKSTNESFKQFVDRLVAALKLITNLG